MHDDIDTLIIYAERYAIHRLSYASGEMAQLVERYTKLEKLSKKTRSILVRDIKQAFKDGLIYYDDQKREWKQTLKVLEESLRYGL